MMKKATLCICVLASALLLAACGGALASASVPASQPASVSRPASEPASEPAEADYSAYSITFEIPEGFAQAEPPEGVSALYQAEDGSSINVVIYENDGSLASDVTQDAIVSLLETTFTQQTGVEAELLNPVFETGKLGDVCPYYRLDYTVSVGDVLMGQTMMGINADRAYTITFTDMTGDWGQAFVNSIASITPVAQ